MSWIYHPSFKRVRAAVLEKLTAKEFHFRKVKRVAFLCGARNSAPRDYLAAYLKKHRTDFEFFYAEKVWNILAERDGANALRMEDELARLADVVVIIVESPGTFTELGAFTLSKALRVKLLPILPREHQGEASFIKSGPVHWIDLDSQFAPSIWAPLASILDAVDEIDERFDRLPKTGGMRVEELQYSPKHLLFFVCDLIAIFGPCSMDYLESCVNEILDESTDPSVSTLVALAVALDLVRPLSDKLFYRPIDENGQLRQFQYRRKYIDPADLRAQVLSVMQTIPDARAAVRSMQEDSLRLRGLGGH